MTKCGHRCPFLDSEQLMLLVLWLNMTCCIRNICYPGGKGSATLTYWMNSEYISNKATCVGEHSDVESEKERKLHKQKERAQEIILTFYFGSRSLFRSWVVILKAAFSRRGSKKVLPFARPSRLRGVTRARSQFSPPTSPPVETGFCGHKCSAPARDAKHF